MAISPRCDRCGVELISFGGILLSPPDAEGFVRKSHLCTDCYTALVGTFGKKD